MVASGTTAPSNSRDLAMSNFVEGILATGQPSAFLDRSIYNVRLREQFQEAANDFRQRMDS